MLNIIDYNKTKNKNIVVDDDNENIENDIFEISSANNKKLFQINTTYGGNSKDIKSPSSFSSSSMSSSDENNRCINTSIAIDSTNSQIFKPSQATTKRAKSTFPFGKCKVCNDKATGVHYGVATCEGCKGFFKRSTIRKEKYRCFFGNNCPLMPENRNRCKACRFRKCLEVGMSIEGVKMGRIPKAEKEKALLHENFKKNDLELDESDDINYSISNNEFENESNAFQTQSISNSNVICRKDDDDKNHLDSQSIINKFQFHAYDNDKYFDLNRKCFNYNQQPDSFTDFDQTINNHQHQSLSSGFSLIKYSNNDINNNEWSQIKPNDFMNKHLKNYNQINNQNLPYQSISASINNIINTNNLKNGKIQYNLTYQQAKSLALQKSSINTNSQHFDDHNHNQSKHQQNNIKTEGSDTIILNESSNTTKENEYNNDNQPVGLKKTKELDEPFSSSNHENHQKGVLLSSPSSQSSSLVLNCSNLNKNTLSINEDLIKSKNNVLRFIDSTYRDYNLITDHKNKRLLSPINHNNMLSTSLADTMDNIHNKHNEKVAALLRRAQHLIKSGTKEYDGHNATIQLVWAGLVESIPQVVKSLIMFAKEIPGLNELSNDDFAVIVNNRLFDFFMLKHSPLLINGESFMMLPNGIQYTRYWMERVIGKEMVDAIFEFSQPFNELNLTSREIALLFPFTLTVKDAAINDHKTLDFLNENYKRAISNEMRKNKRDQMFVMQLCKILSLLPKLNELQVKNIRSLTPQVK